MSIICYNNNNNKWNNQNKYKDIIDYTLSSIILYILRENLKKQNYMSFSLKITLLIKFFLNAHIHIYIY